MTRVARGMAPQGIGGVIGAEEMLTGEPVGEQPEVLAQRGLVNPDAQRAARERAMSGSNVLEKIVQAAVAAIVGDKDDAVATGKMKAQARDDLAELGYDIGEDPSRIDDPKTMDAIKQFQSEHGLIPTGELDLETLMSMVEALMKQRQSKPRAQPRPNSSWSSARPGGAPDSPSNAPPSRTGHSAPQGDYSRAPAANPSERGVSRGPAPNGRVDLSTPEGQRVFEEAGRLIGMSPAEAQRWASSPAMRSLVNHESGGIVGRLNYTYGNRDPASVHAELRNGRITARSSATGLGQLLLSNVDRYYPNGRAGIGDPVQEAAGMMAYIRDRYGTPDVAWGNHSANPRRHQGVPRIYNAEGY